MAKPKKTEGSPAHTPSRQIFTRVAPELADQFEAVAAKARVTVSDYLRWLVEDAVSGAYTPGHLKKNT